MGENNRPPAYIEDEYANKRQEMVQQQIRKRGIKDSRLLSELEALPRHLFVPAACLEKAHFDEPLPIGDDQTISQPYVVAFMIEQLALAGDEKILEIGTGSGYQTALLAGLVAELFTVEIIPNLSIKAEATLKQLHYQNIHFRIDNGYAGWPEEAPFDAIIGSAAPQQIPQYLVDQLKVGGRMILPVGGEKQKLILIEKTDHTIRQTRKLPVRFVPMTGNSGPD